jgi:hypothetical protein
MTHRVKKSLAVRFGDFATRVQVYRSELEGHYAHMLRVEADKTNPNVKDEDRHQPYPAPQAHPEIDKAVRRDEKADGSVEFVADFEIHDDSPSAAAVTAARKREIIAEITRAENEAIDAVVPFGKRRHLAFERDRITAVAEEDRPKADAELLASIEELDRRILEIQRAGAKAMHDVEDLTADNVDSWAMPELPR